MKVKILGNEFVLKEKQFKTGRKGLHASGQLIMDNRLYRVNILLVDVTPGVAKELVK